MSVFKTVFKTANEIWGASCLSVLDKLQDEKVTFVVSRALSNKPNEQQNLQLYMENPQCPLENAAPRDVENVPNAKLYTHISKQFVRS